MTTLLGMKGVNDGAQELMIKVLFSFSCFYIIILY